MMNCRLRLRSMFPGEGKPKRGTTDLAGNTGQVRHGLSEGATPRSRKGIPYPSGSAMRRRSCQPRCRSATDGATAWRPSLSEEFKRLSERGKP